jgi:SAM-dependent methyltransferase
MPKITQGIRSILSIPLFYSLFQKILGQDRAYNIIIKNYLRPSIGDRILDIGCRPADILSYLNQVEYIGFDASDKYINKAMKRYGNKGTFICQLITSKSLTYREYFDIVVVFGVLHHLDDVEAEKLLQLAHSALKPGGRFVAVENCYIDNQSPLARWIISKDRGQNVRDKNGYLEIAYNLFSSRHTSYNIRHDLLRIPYTHIIIECVKND